MLDKITIQNLENFLFCFDMTDHLGSPKDLTGPDNEPWFYDAALVEHITFNAGSWNASLVHAYNKDPYQIVISTIHCIPSLEQARKATFYMKRRAAKDLRGTFLIDIEDFELCHN